MSCRLNVGLHTDLYPLITIFVFGHAVIADCIICAIAAPVADPPTKNPGISAAYAGAGTPIMLRVADPIADLIAD